MEHSTQEVEVTITRLAPCPRHAAKAPGCMVADSGLRVPVGGKLPPGARVVMNPNGYRHDCPDCRRQA